MNLWSNGHDEVAYEARKCPACSAIIDKNRTILELEEEIRDLHEYIQKLEEQL